MFGKVIAPMKGAIVWYVEAGRDNQKGGEKMGTWSANIFDNDGAEEIKEEYKTLLGYGMSLEEAYKRIEDYFYSNYKD